MSTWHTALKHSTKTVIWIRWNDVAGWTGPKIFSARPRASWKHHLMGTQSWQNLQSGGTFGFIGNQTPWTTPFFVDVLPTLCFKDFSSPGISCLLYLGNSQLLRVIANTFTIQLVPHSYAEIVNIVNVLREIVDQLTLSCWVWRVLLSLRDVAVQHRRPNNISNKPRLGPSKTNAN